MAAAPAVSTPSTTVAVAAGVTPVQGIPGTTAGASLYVGDLDDNIQDANLFEIFAQVGAVTSVRVCRDSVTKRSLNYGYVNFATPQDAHHAMDILNYTPVNGRPIRIMWSHRDPSARKSGVGNIFIKNLDEQIDNKMLHDTFTAFGPILSCKIAQVDGKSKGYGFVHFETDEAANYAIEKVNGMELLGKRVYVGKFLKRSDRISQNGDTKFTNVFIKNLDTELTEKEIEEKLVPFGKITNVVIMKDEAGKSKGFGFANFSEPEAAKTAVDDLNGAQFGAKKIYVGRAQKKAEREQMLKRQFEEKRLEQIQKYQGANLYVKNLEDIVDDDQLKNEFSTFGTITSAKVMRDEKGVSRGFGFVCFSSPEEAARAAEEKNGKMVSGKPVYVAVAQRKEARQAQLQQHYAQRVGIMAPPGAALAAAYPPVYYTSPPALLPPVPQRQGLMYQPMGLRPTNWRAGPMAPPGRPGLQPLPPYALVPNPQQRPPQRQMQIPQQQPGYKENGRNQQQRPRQQPVKFVSNGRGRDGPASSNGAALPPGQDVLSLMTTASPQQQKQLLGERLFPLVQAHRYDVAGKITGMLLEMDNSELLLLLESPDALTLKVEEAVLVLEQHAKAAEQDEGTVA